MIKIKYMEEIKKEMDINNSEFRPDLNQTSWNDASQAERVSARYISYDLQKQLGDLATQYSDSSAIKDVNGIDYKKIEKIGTISYQASDPKKWIENSDTKDAKGSTFHQKQIKIIEQIVAELAKEFNLSSVKSLDQEDKKVDIQVNPVDSEEGQSNRYMIEIPKLNRIILAYDNRANEFHVFDSSKFQEFELTVDELKTYTTKQEIDDLLGDDPILGQKIVYSSHFTEDLVLAIKNSMADQESEYDNVIRLFKRDLKDISETTIKETENSKFNQQSVNLEINIASDGVLSTSELAKKLHVSDAVVRSIIRKMTDEELTELGMIKQYRFGSRIVNGYTSLQQSLIDTAGRRQGLIADQASDGVVSIRYMFRYLNMSINTIRQIIDDLGDQLGEINLYKFGSSVAEGLTPKQQALIEAAARERGFKADKASNGILSMKATSRKLRINVTSLTQIIDDLGDQLGKIEFYRFSNIISRGLTPKQQALIEANARERGLIIDKAPEGVLTLRSTRRKLRINVTSLTQIIDDLGDQLGKIELYRFSNNISRGLTPKQQALIEVTARERGLLD